MKDYTAIANQYALDVLSGDIPAAKYIQLACQKHLDDQESQADLDFPYQYSAAKAHKACKFIEAQYHTKGKWAKKKQLLIMEPWQVFFVVNVFGWLQRRPRLSRYCRHRLTPRNNCDNKDIIKIMALLGGLRRYVEVLLLVPRKNGKSALAAAIALYMLCADGEYGAEVYTGATSEKQAKEVFTPARLMALKNPDMCDYFSLEVNASNLNTTIDGGKLEPVIGDPPDGSSPSCAIADEVHEHKDSRLIDTMMTGMGAREQPIMLYITTAGDNIAGPCYQLQQEAQKSLEGTIEAPQLFALIYGVDEGDEWSSEESLIKANPNFGVSVGMDFLKARLQDARNNARKQSTYKTKHLNIWVGARDAYFNVEQWKKCVDTTLEIEDYYGMGIYAGLDLASRRDIAALEILITLEDGTHVRFGKYYLPEAALEGNEHYQTWDTDGWLTITDGEIIDFSIIKEDILELASLFEMKELGYDPFQATMLITSLMDEGVPVVEMRPTVLNFSEPMKDLDGLIAEQKILNNGDPVMAWMISNVVAKEDAKENVYPRKDRPENKIDGVISLLMALGRQINQEEGGKPFDIGDLIAPATL